MILHHCTWLFSVIFLFLSVGVSARTRIFSKTRWRPSAGTLHSVVLWHEVVNPQKTLPIAKKIFNFSRQDQAKALEEVASSFSRKALGKTMDIELREVAAFFSEKITKFVQQKRRDHTSFACIFKTNDVQKTTVVEIQLTRSKSKEIAGELVMFGRCKEPQQEIVNLLHAVVLDDSSLRNYFTKGLWCVGAFLAWLKLKDLVPKIISQHSSLSLFLEKGKKEDLYAKPSLLPSDDSLRDDDSPPMDDEDASVDGEGVLVVGDGSTDISPHLAAAPFFDRDAQVDVDAMVQPEHVVLGKASACGGSGRIEKKDAATQIEPIFFQRRKVFPKRYEQVSPAARYARELYDSAIKLCGVGHRYSYSELSADCKLTIENSAILDDDSFFFVCEAGVARIVVYDIAIVCDIDRLRQEQQKREVVSDKIVTLWLVDVHCLEQQRRCRLCTDKEIAVALKGEISRDKCFDSRKESNFISCVVFQRERKYEGLIFTSYEQSWCFWVIQYDVEQNKMICWQMAECKVYKDILFEIINFVKMVLKPSKERGDRWRHSSIEA